LVIGAGALGGAGAGVAEAESVSCATDALAQKVTIRTQKIGSKLRMSSQADKQAMFHRLLINSNV
jgi:hypothetical protein